MIQLLKNIGSQKKAKILDFEPKSKPPAYTYTLIMLSVHTAEGDLDKVASLREHALAEGADLQQIEMADLPRRAARHH